MFNLLKKPHDNTESLEDFANKANDLSAEIDAICENLPSLRDERDGLPFYESQ